MRATPTILMLLLAAPAALASPVNVNEPGPGLPPAIGVNDPVDDAVELVLLASEDTAAAAVEAAEEEVEEGADDAVETAHDLTEAILRGEVRVNLTDPDDYIFLSSAGNETYTRQEYEACLDDKACDAPVYDQSKDFLTGFRVMDASYADGGRDVAVIFPMAYEHPATSADSRLLEGLAIAVDKDIAPEIFVGPSCANKPVAGGTYGFGVYAFQGAAPCTGIGSNFSGILERVG